MVGIYSPMGSAAIWKFPILGWVRFLCVVHPQRTHQIAAPSSGWCIAPRDSAPRRGAWRGSPRSTRPGCRPAGPGSRPALAVTAPRSFECPGSEATVLPRLLPPFHRRHPPTVPLGGFLCCLRVFCRAWIWGKIVWNWLLRCYISLFPMPICNADSQRMFFARICRHVTFVTSFLIAFKNLQRVAALQIAQKIVRDRVVH